MPRELQIWDRFHRLRELAIVKHAAFRTNAFHAASYPSHDQAIMEHFLEKREWGFSNADTEQHIVVIVDTDMMGRDGEEGRKYVQKIWPGRMYTTIFFEGQKIWPRRYTTIHFLQ